MNTLWKQKKRKRSLGLLTGVICAAALFTGCAGKEDIMPESTDGGMSEEAAGVFFEEKELSADELEEFTKYVNKTENNGFLQCYYAEPVQVDLGEVLYNGAGFEMSPLSEEELKLYEELGYSIETDVFRLTADQIEEFLRRKMGIGMADVSKGLGWTYLEETDSYVAQHGDTNFCYFTCTKGKLTGEGEYEIHCTAVDAYVSDCVIKLRKSGEEYQFVSNMPVFDSEEATASQIIEEQSFLVELNDWGMVRFVSLAPNTLEDPRQDVTFELWKNDETVYTFPQVAGDNMRIVDTFCNIEAVSFRDYDKDGYTDVIIICTYQRDLGESAGGRYQEARIYRGAEKSFRYMDELSLSVNITQNNKTIAQIIERIEQGEINKIETGGEKQDILKQLKVFAEAKDQWNYEDYDPFPFSFAIYDLDGDGRLELLTYITAGTGLFSENHFYRVNSSGDGIEELPQEYYAETGEFEIWMEEQAYQDEESGVIYYLASDVEKNGYADSWRLDGAYYLAGGCVYSVALRGMHTLIIDEAVEESYYDPAGIEISKEAWVVLYENFLRNKKELDCTISWRSIYPEELRKASTEEILELLADSCAMAGL